MRPTCRARRAGKCHHVHDARRSIVATSGPDQTTVANGISGGNIVGIYNAANPGGGFNEEGFVYNGSSYTTIGGTTGFGSFFPFGISGNNIVGQYFGTVTDQITGTLQGQWNGFLYNGSTYTTVTDPLGSNGTFAYGVSGSNVVGYYTDSAGYDHGFLYNGSTYTTIDEPLSVGGTYVYGISGNEFVGYYYGSSGQHGFLFNGSTYTNIDDPLASYGNVATGVSGNNIVGTYDGPPNTDDRMHGFLYNGSTYTTIDDPLAAFGTYINGISGNEIVGYYVDAFDVSHGFVATIPEPSSTALLSIGAIGLAVMARRRVR